MKNPTVLAALAAAFLGISSVSGSAQQLSLDITGGLVGENLTCNLSGVVPPGEFVIVTFSNTTGPLPMSTFFPGDPSFLDQDLTMFNYPSFLQGSAYVNPLGVVDLTTLSPAFTGFMVFGQAWTTAGGNPFVDKKSNTVTFIVGAHGASTPTYQPPVFGHSYSAFATLADGNILIAGGGNGLGASGTAGGETYDSRSASFIATNGSPQARAAAPGTLLNDGRVLICGGIDGGGLVTNGCELYDPATKTFGPAAAMATSRVLHAAVKLADGRVYVCGGSTSVSGTDPVSQLLAMVSSATSSAEIYNPTNNTWSPAASLSSARTGHSAAILPDGRVLVAGGVQPGILGIPTFLTSATRYNPTSNSYNATASMTGTARAISSPVVLGDGRVMVAGGVTANIIALTANAVGDVSIYNNTTNTWQNGPNLAMGRYGSPAVLIGGKVVLGGGVVGSVSSTTTPSTTASVEQYNPISNTWAGLVPMLEPRAAQAVGLTPDGKRIVYVGGANDLGTIFPPTAELYVP